MMVDVWVRLNKSRHLVPDQPAEFVKIKDFAPGALLKVSVRKPRRKKHHRLYFGAISVAFDNWPEGHEFQPDNPEHLRAWLQCKAGHRNIFGETLHCDGSDVYRMVSFSRRAMEKITEAGGYGFFSVVGGAIVLLTPKSVAYDKLDEAEFSKVSQPVFDVIERETGMKVNDLMEMAKGLDEKEVA